MHVKYLRFNRDQCYKANILSLTTSGSGYPVFFPRGNHCYWFLFHPSAEQISFPPTFRDNIFDGIFFS